MEGKKWKERWMIDGKKVKQVKKGWMDGWKYKKIDRSVNSN